MVTYIFFTYQMLIFWCMFVNEVLIFLATSMTTLSWVTSLLIFRLLHRKRSKNAFRLRVGNQQTLQYTMHLLDNLFLHSHKGSGLVLFQLIALITNTRFFIHRWSMFHFLLLCDVIMNDEQDIIPRSQSMAWTWI